MVRSEVSGCRSGLTSHPSGRLRRRLIPALEPMIDLHARSKLAGASRSLVAGLITNHEFDDRIPRSSDPAIREIYNKAFWLMYCDLRQYHLKGRRTLHSISQVGSSIRLAGSHPACGCSAHNRQFSHARRCRQALFVSCHSHSRHLLLAVPLTRAIFGGVGFTTLSVGQWVVTSHSRRTAAPPLNSSVRAHRCRHACSEFADQRRRSESSSRLPRSSLSASSGRVTLVSRRAVAQSRFPVSILSFL